MEEEIKKTEQAEIQPQKKTFRDRVTSLYPDTIPQNDDDLDALYNRYADEKEAKIKDMEGDMEIILEVLNSDEDARAVISEMVVNKTPFRAAIAKFLSEEDLTPIEGDQDYEAVRNAYNERLERGKKRTADMEQIAKNEEQTYQDFETFTAEKGMSEEQKTELDNTIGMVFNNLLFKKITPEMLEMFYKAMDYDMAIEKAKGEGELRGRNAAIEAKRVASLRNNGDGLPNIVGGGAEPVSDNKESDKVTFLGRKRNNI